MNRFRRACWTAARGVWLWLGFGLHQELPRDLGPPIVARPLKDANLQVVTPVGFIGDTNRFVVVYRVGEHLRSFTEIRVYNGETGEVVLTAPGPAYSDFLGH